MGTAGQQLDLAQQELQQIVEELAGCVNQWFLDRPLSEVAAKSRRAVQRIYIEKSERVKLLFQRVERRLVVETRSTPDRFSQLLDPSTTIWEHLVGATQDWTLDHAATNILAIILSIATEKPSYLLRTWDRLLELLELSRPAASGITRPRDISLPLSLTEISYWLRDEELVTDFSYEQHRFCQVEPTELEVHFSDQRSNMKKVMRGLKKECVSLDKGGVPEEGVDLNEIWISSTDLDTTLCDHQSMLEKLHMGWYNSQRHRRLPTSTRYLERRTWYEEAKVERERFMDGLRPRRKLSAILISVNDDSESASWTTFFKACCDPTSDEHLELDDSRLPLSSSHIGKYFEKEDRQIFNTWQLRFCPVTPKREEEIVWPHEEFSLPLLQKRLVGEGCFGKVYRVEFAPEYSFWQDNRTGLAMKVVLNPDKRSYTEWRLTEKISSQDMKSRGIMKSLASVRTRSAVCLFMPLADCSLYDFMMHTAGPNSNHERIKMLGYMRDVARALRTLHCDLWREERVKDVCIHGDVKTANILYTKNAEFPLQLSDFGISMFEYKPMGVLDGEKMIHTARKVRTRLRLDKACANCPPEAESSHEGTAAIEIWAFGIVLSEYVAWLAGGASKLENLKQARGSARGLWEERSYQLHPDTKRPQLKPEISAWFHALIEGTHDADDKQLFSNCWYLICNGLLVCDDEARATIEQVCEALERTLDRGILESIPPPPVSRKDTAGNVSGIETLQLASGQPAILRVSTGPNRMLPAPTPSSDSVHSTNNHSEPSTPAKTSSQPSLASPLKATQRNQSINESTGLSSSSGSLPRSSTDHSSDNEIRTELWPSRGGPTLSPEPSNASTSGRSPASQKLMVALQNGESGVAAELIRSGADVGFRDRAGNTALHQAVCCKASDAVKQLLDSHPILLRKVNNDGRTALHKCVTEDKRSGPGHARLLLERDAA